MIAEFVVTMNFFDANISAIAELTAISDSFDITYLIPVSNMMQLLSLW